MQTQAPPAQTHTLDSLRTALVTHKPHLEPVLTTVFNELAKPETPTEKITEQLKTVLERDVTPAETTTDRSFSWRNQAEREIVLTIPRDTPSATATEAPAAEEERAAPQEAAASDEAAAPATSTEPQDDDSEAHGDGDDGDAPTHEPALSLLGELDALLEHTNLHLMIMRAGERDGQRLLSVTVVPQATSEKTDPALLTPINLTGTIPELEAGLPRAIAATQHGNQSIEEAIQELEDAKKEAAAQKKAEAAKARKGAKKGAAAKKDEAKADAKDEKKPDGKKDEAKSEPPAATPMFDTPTT